MVIRGDGNYFYQANALCNDKVSDEKHEEICRSSSSLIERNPKVLSRYFSPMTPWRIMSKTARSRELGLKLWTSSAVHHSLSDPFAPSHRCRKYGTTLNWLWTRIHFHRSQKRSASVQSLWWIMMSMLGQIILISFCQEVAVVVLRCLGIQHPLFQ